MSSNLKSGDFVEHGQWGLGKVINADGRHARIYFKGRPDAVPEKRYRRIWY